MKLVAFHFVLFLFAASPSLAAAEDWSAWLGPNGSNASLESGLPDHFDRETGENIAWVRKLGDVAFGTPTVSDGRVYIGTNMAALSGDDRFNGLRGGVLACLEEQSGAPVWFFASPERRDGLPPNTHLIHQRWGLCSSPTIDGDRVYIVSNGNDVLCLDVAGLHNGNDGPFQEEGAFLAGEGRSPIALDPARDGDVLWRFDIPRELDVAPHDVASSSALIVGDVAYVATSNGIGTGSPVYALNPKAPAFIALDKYTGDYLARETAGISEALFHAQWGSASRIALADRTLILLGGNDGYCHAFAPLDPATDHGGTIRAVWRYDANPEHFRRYPDGKPIYYYQGDLRVFQKKVRAGEDTAGFNSGDGTFVGPCEILASPVAWEGRVYVVTGRDPLHGPGRGVLSCIDPTRLGEVTHAATLWRYEGIGRSLASVAAGDGMVYAADLQGRVHALDAVTGRVHWVHDTGNPIWGNPLLADGKVYVSTRHSFVILRAGTKLEVIFQTRGGSETGPIAANGAVYAFIRGKLYRIAGGGLRK